MDAVLAGGVFGVGGILLGAGLNEWSARRGRREVHREQQEAERHARELVVAERLDEALVNAQKAIEFSPTDALEKALRSARLVWEDAWIAYSPRIRQHELLLRYSAVGSILAEYALSEDSIEPAARRIVGRAIANARSTLAHFMRGGEPLPPTAFPEPDELKQLLAAGDGTNEPMGPLKKWLSENELPEFHPTDTERAQ
jgi:hypothetical protein